MRTGRRLCPMHVKLMPLEVVLVAENVTAHGAPELALRRMRLDVGAAHHLRLETPLAAGKIARKRTTQVVNALVLTERRAVGVRVAAYVADDAAGIVDLSVGADRRVDARHEATLVAAEFLLLVNSSMNSKIRAALVRFSAVVAHKLLFRLVRL